MPDITLDIPSNSKFHSSLNEIDIAFVPSNYISIFSTIDKYKNINEETKEIVKKCKEAGVILTNAGAPFPYGKDPKDSNIRIAPSFPSAEEMAQATDLFVLCVKLATVEKLLAQK